MSGTWTSPWSRSLQRAVHLVFAGVLVAYFHTPLSEMAQIDLVMKVVILPVLTLSGVLMWKGGQLRLWYRSRRTEQQA